MQTFSQRQKLRVARTEAPVFLAGAGDFVLIVLGVLLLSLAFPAFATNLLLLPGDAARDSLNSGQGVDAAGMESLIRSRLRVAKFRPDNQTCGDLALAFTEKARRAGFATETGKADLREAAEWQLRALQASPADSFGWSRLVYLLSLTEGASSPKLMTALTMEIQTAPYEPQLMVRRLATVLYLYDRLDPDLKASVPDLMRAAWKLYPDHVDAIAKDRHMSAFLLETLRSSPETAALLKLWRGL